jgi:hypothetical protein
MESDCSYNNVNELDVGVPRSSQVGFVVVFQKNILCTHTHTYIEAPKPIELIIFSSLFNLKFFISLFREVSIDLSCCNFFKDIKLVVQFNRETMV